MVKFILGVAAAAVIVSSVLLTKGVIMFVEMLGANFITGTFVFETFFVILALTSMVAMVIGIRSVSK